MNENKIIETLKYISQFVKNEHDEGLGDYLHIVIGRTDINVIDETIYLLERKQKEIVRYKKEIEEKTTILLAGAEKVKQLEKEIQRLEKDNDTLSELVIVNEDKVIKELDLISKDKIREKIDKYRKKSEKLHSQELWNEPEDSIKDFKYNHYIEAYKELLEE